MRTENDSNKEGRPVDTMEPLDHTRGVKFLSAVRKALRGHSEHAQNLGPIGGKLQSVPLSDVIESLQKGHTRHSVPRCDAKGSTAQGLPRGCAHCIHLVRSAQEDVVNGFVRER